MPAQDDSVEQPVATLCEGLGIGVEVLELPKEGQGLTTAMLSQIASMRETARGAADGGLCCCIFDFDCTLSSMHLFKTFYSSKSSWAKEWQALDEELASHQGADVEEKSTDNPNR